MRLWTCLVSLAFVILSSFILVSCGSDGVERAFLGESRCLASASAECECVEMNSPEHQQLTGLTILKCPHHSNFIQAQDFPFCLNWNPETGRYREQLSLDGCPWVETPEEAQRLLGSATDKW